MNYLDSLSLSLQRYTEIIVKELRFQSYHFIELFIYFNNFIENEGIEQESFITANTTLLNPEEEDEEGVESLSVDIFNAMSLNDNDTVSLPALSCYLKKISISTSCEFDVDVLFAILDKDNKGYIDYNDIEIIIGSFEDFLDDDNGGKGTDWAGYEKLFANKKLVKKNLMQNNFFENVKQLFKRVNQEILNRIEKVRVKEKEMEEERKKEKELSNKNSIKDNSNSNNPANNGVTLYKKSESAIKLNSNNNQSENNITNSININTINNNPNAKIPLDEMLFDKSKYTLIKKIRQSTYLYDISYDDFLLEIAEYEPQPFTKLLFINVMCKIISKKTSDLLINPIMRMALSMLFQIIDSDKKNQISFYEALGALIPLTKNTNSNDKVKILYTYPKPIMYELLSGAFSLYLNTKMIKDLEIFSEIVFKQWDEDKIANQNDLVSWAFNFSTPIPDNEPYAYYTHPIILPPSSNEITELMRGIKEKYSAINNNIMKEISQLSILDLTNRIIQYSFLGVINNHQLNTLLETVIDEKYQEFTQKAKMKIKDNFLNAIEQHFAFTQNELIDVTHLQAFCMLIFSGSTIEKFQSIFIIHDLRENEPIEYDDLYQYLTYLFGFAIKQSKIIWKDSKVLAKIICDYIFDKVDKKFTLTCLMQVYESLAIMNKKY